MRRSVIIPILYSSTAATSLAVPPSPDSHRPDGKLQRRNTTPEKIPFSASSTLQAVTAFVPRLAANAFARLLVPSCPDCSRFLRRPRGGGASGPRCVQIELSHLVEQGLVADAQHFRGILAAPARLFQRVRDGFHLRFIFQAANQRFEPLFARYRRFLSR